MGAGDYVRGCGRFGLRRRAYAAESGGDVAVDNVATDPSSSCLWTFGVDVVSVENANGGAELQLLIDGAWIGGIGLALFGSQLSVTYDAPDTSVATAWRVTGPNVGWTLAGGACLAWPQQGTL